MSRRDISHLLACLAAALLLAACADGKSNAGSSKSAGAHEHHQSLPAADAISGRSLHQLASAWTNQFGQQRRWADFAGRVVVLAMVYTHCDNACPRIIADLRRIRQGLGEQADAPVFVLASIDPERDSVEHLRHFGEETGLTDLNWQLLRAPEATIRELAAVLGVQYRRVSETDFAHSSLITVLAASGEIVHQQQGLGTAPDATIAAIRGQLD